jgi:hypothetical protein
MHLPQDFQELDDSHEFMALSNCHAQDFMHPEYARICRELKRGQHFHRKVWEWVFIIHHLEREGVLRPGARGLGFGVGKEPLTAYFAWRGAEITATDAPPEIVSNAGWAETGQYSQSIDSLRHDAICPYDVLLRRVRHRYCDMTRIGDEFQNFDFNWSACCFEHLGDLDAGIDFIVKSTEQTLRKGGVGVHTTELNLSSTTTTVERGDTVLYREADLRRLIDRLEERGHSVRPLRIDPGQHPIDQHVDVPPYSHNPHLKLQLLGYVSRSGLWSFGGNDLSGEISKQ